EFDEKLQKAFRTYLEVRGFEPNIGKFLFNYMVQREDTNHARWLKCLKNFISISSSNSNLSGKALSDFPFKIEEEDVAERTITLTREYQGDEEIKVTVDHKHYCGRYVDLKGTVLNKTGLTLDFHGTIDETDGFEIRSLDVKDPNASDENLPSHWIWMRSLRMLSAHIWKTEGLNQALLKFYMTA
ncbi:hypothetical protein MKX03_037815, partial [Papaver bracteatum]